MAPTPLAFVGSVSFDAGTHNDIISVIIFHFQLFHFVFFSELAYAVPYSFVYCTMHSIVKPYWRDRELFFTKTEIHCYGQAKIFSTVRVAPAVTYTASATLNIKSNKRYSNSKDIRSYRSSQKYVFDRSVFFSHLGLKPELYYRIIGIEWKDFMTYTGPACYIVVARWNVDGYKSQKNVYQNGKLNSLNTRDQPKLMGGA